MVLSSTAAIASRFLSTSHFLRLSAKRTIALAARDVLSNVPAPELTSIKNGFRVVTENNGRPMTTVGVWIDSGSRYEDEKSNGVATFLEHMLYRGTNNRSPTQLELDLEAIGAQLSSYTSREHSSFYVQCASGDVERAVEILADILRDSKFDDASIETERHVVLRELNELENDPSEIAVDYMHNAAFQRTPMARSVYGIEEVIKKLTKNDLRKHMERNFKPVRMVLSAVGDVDHQKLSSLVEKYFSDLTNSYAEEVPAMKGVRFTGSEFLYRNDALPFMYGSMAVEGVGLSHGDVIPLKVASAMIGNWDCTQQCTVNSPTMVAQKISNGLGVHQFQSFSLNYNDCGLFGFSIVMNGDSIYNTTDAMKEVTRGWKHLAVSATNDEIERGKNMYKTTAFSLLESNAVRADDLAKQVLCSNSVMSLSDFDQAIDNVDKAAVNGAMSRHVYDRDFVAAGVGRTEAWPDYYQLRIGMSCWRL